MFITWAWLCESHLMLIKDWKLITVLISHFPVFGPWSLTSVKANIEGQKIYNFGPNLQHWISMFYKDISSRIINNALPLNTFT